MHCRLMTRMVLLSITASCAAQPQPETFTDGDLVLFMQRDDASVEPLAILGDVPAQMINKAADGRKVVVATLPRNWRHTLPRVRGHSLEILVLAGELSWSGRRLSSDGYAWLPVLAPPPVLATGNNPPTLLLFVDPPRPTDGA